MCMINLFYTDNDVDRMGQMSRRVEQASTRNMGLELILFEQVEDIYKNKTCLSPEWNTSSWNQY
jgi:hypothetical protein